MENTVTISLKEYDELRDFKKSVESGKNLVMTCIKDKNNEEYFKSYSFYSIKLVNK